MKRTITLALSALLLAVVAIAGDKLPDGDHGDLYHPNGTPSGGEWNSFGPRLDIDKDGFGQGHGGIDVWWDPSCECYTGPGYISEDYRVFTECVGSDPEGNCICWSYEIWWVGDSPPFQWRKIDEGLMY